MASTFAMMTFAILYFGIMLTAGMFDPMVDKVVSWCKDDPLKVLVGTAVLAAFAAVALLLTGITVRGMIKNGKR